MAVRFQSPVMPPVEAVHRYFARSVREGWFSNDGPCHRLLRTRLAEFVGAGAFAVPVANATVGIGAALRECTDAARAREVLLPSFTFVAAVSACLASGLRPVFIDVDEDHWHVSEEILRAALEDRGERVAAVLLCSSFGSPPPGDVCAGWEAACRDAGVPLVVDSAAGFGSITDGGRRLGLQGDAEVFSFHCTKPFAVGEGGVITTSDADLAERLLRAINFGFDQDREISGSIGTNGKMSEWHAAVALAVLDRFDETLARRRAAAWHLLDRIEPLGYECQWGSRMGTWQFVPVRCPSADWRDRLVWAGSEQGIEIRTYYRPLHWLAACREFVRCGELATTDDLGARLASLPVAAGISDQQVDEIFKVVAKVAADHHEHVARQ
jgi:dTDP-4-amino-4,6-dideoxygalactose transaminase